MEKQNVDFAELFEPLLEKGEVVEKIILPNKRRFWWGVGLNFFFGFIWLFVIPIPFLWSEGNWVGADSTFWTVFGIVVGLFVLVAIITIIVGMLWLNKRYHAYTDRRILIRTGIIGIDYKSLEYKSMNATVVKVGFLDKLVRQNTGTIKFGSPSSPVMSIWSGHSNQYMFMFVEKPYETLKELKEFMHTKGE